MTWGFTLRADEAVRLDQNLEVLVEVEKRERRVMERAVWDKTGDSIMV